MRTLHYDASKNGGKTSAGKSACLPNSRLVMQLSGHFNQNIVIYLHISKTVLVVFTEVYPFMQDKTLSTSATKNW